MDSKESTVSEKDIEKLSDAKYTDAEQAIVRKLDFFYVMPFVFIVCSIQFIDKLAINYASAMGILTDTHITNDQFGFVGSVFYIGSLVAQIPTIFLIHKFSAKNCLGILVICWGTTLALTSLAKNYSHLVALRFILGLFETSANPCCVLIINRLYRRNEQARRVNVIALGTVTALTFGSLIGYGIGNMKNIRGLHAWQWLMIILGSFTILCGIFILYFMIEDPKSKLLRLTPEQEKIVDLRMIDNALIVSHKMNFAHIKEALTESRYYCLILCCIFVNIQSGALQTFSTIIISNFGYTGLNAILLGIPSGVFKMVFSLIAVWYVGRYGNLHYTAILTCAVTALGWLLLLTIPVAKAKLLGVYLSFLSGFINTFIHSCITNNVIGYTKKIFYISSSVFSITLGNFIGPLLMIDNQKPLYLGGTITYLVVDVIAMFLFLICRQRMSRINQRRINNPVDKLIEDEDPTDQKNPNFIYKL